MERWSAIDAEDAHLATIRVYHNATGPSGKKPRIVLFLPPNHDPNDPNPPPPNPARPTFTSNTSFVTSTSGSEPDSYELDMINDAVENQIVVAERPKDPLLSVASTAAAATVNTRARTTILTGRIKHDCNLRPVFSESYRRQMKERSKKYNTPQRQIMMIEDAGVSGGRGGINRLSSGVGVGAGSAFGDLIVRPSLSAFYMADLEPHCACPALSIVSCQKSKPKPAKGAFERMARMPRNQLLDLIFSLFRENSRWGIKPLREKTQQPEAYLKQTLGEVAWLHRSGEYNGMWELKENFKEEGVRTWAYYLSRLVLNLFYGTD